MNSIREKIDFFFYKNKNLILYIFIGIFSIFCELIIRKILLSTINENGASFLSFFFGIIICFLLNTIINFNVPKYFFLRSLIYFLLISSFSIFFQRYVLNFYFYETLTYEENRYLISGCFFFVSYLLHKNFSFKYKRTVGIAIYLNDKENIDKIFENVGNYPDFIHIDLVDNTILKNETLIDLDKILKIKSLWPKKETHLHIMSKTPSKWIEKTIKFVDIIYFHYEIDEDIIKIKKFIESRQKIAGIVLHVTNNYDELAQITNTFKELLILSIKNPGFSGQNFEKESFNVISKLNEFKNRVNFNLCIDGGVTSSIIPKLKCDKVVSGSDVLLNINPKKQIMRLKTLSRYEK